MNKLLLIKCLKAIHNRRQTTITSKRALEYINSLKEHGLTNVLDTIAKFDY